MGMSMQQSRNASQTAVQIVVPIYNEGENARILCKALADAGVTFDSLKFVYDLDQDITLPIIAELNSSDSRIIAEKNEYGPGVVKALSWGFSHATEGPVLVVMGDNSDKLDIIPQMIKLWQDGATIVSPSRYMRGGKQYGGGLVKSTLSRIAGVSLKLCGFPTADPTNNFKLYDGVWLRQQQIESVGGFEIALELCYKAYRDKLKIVELPTEWRDRTMGESRFKLGKWLPKYLRWYFKALGQIVLRKLRIS